MLIEPVERQPGEYWAAPLPGDPAFYLHHMSADGEIHVDEGVAYESADACHAAYRVMRQRRDDAFEMEF